MDVDNVISELNRASRDKGSAEFRESALDILHDVIHFDTASWSSIIAGQPVPHDMQLWHQQNEMIDEYLKVLTCDIVSLCTKDKAGEPQLFNWFSSEDLRQSEPVFRSYCENSGYMNVLSIMVEGRSSSYTSLSLSRRDAGQPFNEAESCIVKRIMPHLMNAWVANHALNPSPPSDVGPCEAIAMACSRSGRFLGDSARLKAIFDEACPNTDTDRLPSHVLAEINKNSSWSNAKIEISSKPVSDVHLLSIRRVGTNLLTTRELEICRHATHGLTQKQIAKKLGISPGTVKNHLHNSYAKLNVGNRISLSRMLDLHLA